MRRSTANIRSARLLPRSSRTSSNATAVLRQLEQAKLARGESAAQRKLDCLKLLAGQMLPNANQVRRLHEALCFLRAYPDDRRVLKSVEKMLTDFAGRADLAEFREVLANSGIAGTPIYFIFYFETVNWLCRRWSPCLHIDWQNFEDTDKLHVLLPLLMPTQDALTLEDTEQDARALIGLLKGTDESDAGFLVRRFAALDAHALVRQKLYDDLELPMVLRAGDSTPSRTTSKLRGLEVFYTNHAGEPESDWRQQKPIAIRNLGRARALRVVELGRTQMITRERDLFAFMNASADDVCLYDMGAGLQFARIGLAPEARYLIETMYVYLALQNGVPIGYMQASALLESAEINFSIFESFRGADAKRVFGSFLAMVRHSLGCDAFIINTQQLGQGNSDALKTGAWWFYHKFGFRSQDAIVQRLMRAELRRKARNQRHRSSLSTLKQLAADNLYLFMNRPRVHTVSTIDVEAIGLRMSRYLAARFGADREKSFDICAKEAATALGLKHPPPGTRAQKQAWRNWAVLILLLPGIASWSKRDRQAMVELVLAKGGKRESDYLLRFDRHTRLRQAILCAMESP